MKPALDVEGLVVEIAGRRILDDVSLHVERSEFLCLLGPNGGGKTTLLKAVLGLAARGRRAHRRAGRAAREGPAPRGLPAPAQGLRPEFPGHRGRPHRGRARRRLAAARAGRRAGGRAALPATGGRARACSTSPLAALSGGETQRVFLARALVNAPELLLLDEPTAGVDARGREEFLDLLDEVIAEQGRHWPPCS